MPGFFGRRAFGSLCDLTVKDALCLVVPFFWTIVACCLFSYYTVDPLIHQKLPKTIPMYWSLISAFPAAVTSLNYYIFLRSAVVESGMSRFSISELSQVMRLIGILGMCCFIILAVASGIQLAECRNCDHDSYGENVAWCIVTLMWMIIMACSAPSTKHYSKLVFKHETSNNTSGGVGTVFGRLSVADPVSFVGTPQPNNAEEFVRAGVEPTMVAQGKVAGKANSKEDL